MSDAPAYDRVGLNYAEHRRADPRIAARIWAALGDARSVVNVGAGSGSYEPRDRDVIAIEPSPVMIGQRPAGAAPAIEGVAEALPLEDKSVDAAMGTLTIHHWDDLGAGLAEMRRVARRRIVLFTIDAEKNSEVWTLSEYFPAAARAEREKMPSMERLEALLPAATIEPVPAPSRIHQRPLGQARALPRAQHLACKLALAQPAGGGDRVGPGAAAGRPGQWALGREVRPPPHPARARHRPAPGPRRAVSDVTIRGAGKHDGPAIVDLWTEAYFTEGEGGRDTPYELAEFEATAASATHLLVAERNEEVVGVVALLGPEEPSRAVATEGEAELARLVVGSGTRRRGIGRALAERCAELARVEGWSAIALWSRPYQTAGHRLYEALGYERAPERDTVDETGFGRLVFRLSL